MPIQIKLKDAIERYNLQTGERLTYDELAKRTGIARATIESIASRSNYNASLKIIDMLCRALSSTPDLLLEYNETEDKT